MQIYINCRIDLDQIEVAIESNSEGEVVRVIVLVTSEEDAGKVVAYAKEEKEKECEEGRTIMCEVEETNIWNDYGLRFFPSSSTHTTPPVLSLCKPMGLEMDLVQVGHPQHDRIQSTKKNERSHVGSIG